MRSDFSILIHKYLRGSISPAELEQLGNMMAPGKDLGELNEMIAMELKKDHQASPEDDEIKALIFGRLETRLDAWEDGAHGKLIAYSPFRSHFWKSLAAACLILVIAGGSFLAFRYNKQDTKVAATTHHSADPAIAPGTNKAVLTLADGSKILLDDRQKGNIAVQGGVKVIKLNNGILAYNGTTEAGKTMFNTITTPRGGQYQIVLPDGTRTWLNSASSLRFPAAFTGTQREVFLSGEGYFEVARNTAQPFIVKAGNTSVNVLGTSFNIMAYEDEPELNTTLVDGAVLVNHQGTAHKLKPGEQAHLDMQSQKMGIVNADVEEVTAWKNGKFRFGKSNIKTIMRQMARWYDVQVDYNGDLSTIQLSGILSRKENASELLDALEETGDVRFITSGKHITVVPGTAHSK